MSYKFVYLSMIHMLMNKKLNVTPSIHPSSSYAQSNANVHG